MNQIEPRSLVAVLSNTFNPDSHARTRYLRRCSHQCSGRSHSLQGGLSFLRPSCYWAHPMAISSSTILISVQDSPPGRTLVNAGRPDLICILCPLRRHPLLKVMREAGCLSEASGARRDHLSDHQNLATHRILTYSI